MARDESDGTRQWGYTGSDLSNRLVGRPSRVSNGMDGQLPLHPGPTVHSWWFSGMADGLHGFGGSNGLRRC